MEKAKLPTEDAQEPDESARDPKEQDQDRLPRKHLTFSRDTDLSQESGSQTRNYKDVLSQPAQGLTHHQRLIWLQKRRTLGLWAQCDDCDRWRFLPNILDRHELPNKWYCRMNPDLSNASCAVPEAPIQWRDEEDLIHSLYSCGSVVWARLPGWPWWPAMVDDCPDTEQFYWLDGFSDIPTHYNVVFFDSTEVTRAWIAPDNLKPYVTNTNMSKEILKIKKYKTRSLAAVTQADDATKMELAARLARYSFIARWNGNLYSPRKVTKKQLLKHQKQLKRKYNIDFPINSDSDEDVLNEKTMKKNNNNVILVGTPKKDVGIRTSIRNTLLLGTVNTQIVADSKNVDKTMKTALTEHSEHAFKHPDSMAVQVGSTAETVAGTESYDNDTSKTYVPDFVRQSMESTDESVTEMGTQEFEMRAGSPKSDDFEFN